MEVQEKLQELPEGTIQELVDYLKKMAGPPTNSPLIELATMAMHQNKETFLSGGVHVQQLHKFAVQPLGRAWCRKKQCYG
jgi:hypothetical protein